MRYFVFYILLFLNQNSIAQGVVSWKIKPEIYTKFELWRENRFIVKVHEKMGLIDLNGNQKLKIQYDNIIPLGENALAIEKNGLYAIIHYKSFSENKLKFEWKFLEYFEYSDTVFWSLGNDQFRSKSENDQFSINVTSEKVIITKENQVDVDAVEMINEPVPPTTSLSENNISENNLTETKSNEKKFKWSSKYQYIKRHEILENGKTKEIFVVKNENGNTGIIDSLENVLMTFDYFFIHQFDNSIFEIGDHNSNRFLLDIISGNKTRENIYYDFHKFQNINHDVISIRGVTKRDSIGEVKGALFDKNLKELIPPSYYSYNYITRGSNILTARGISNKWGVININNQIVVPIRYYMTGILYDNLRKPMSILVYNDNRKAGLMTISGEKITDEEFDFIGPVFNDNNFERDAKNHIKENFYLVIKNGFYGVFEYSR